MTRFKAPQHPHAATIADVASALRVDPDAGPGEDEARARLATHGPNRLREAQPQSVWNILVSQCKSNVIVLMAAAAALAFSFAQVPEGIAFLGVLIVNAGIGFFRELRAVRSMEALRRIGGNPQVMKRGPRRAGEPVLTHQHWLAIGGWSALMAACVLVGLVAAIGVFHMEPERAVTVSFLTLAFAKLWFVFNLRDRGSRPLDNDVVRNPWIWGAITLCALLLVAAVYAPRLSDLLRTAHLGASGWTLALGLSLVPVSIGQVIRGLRNAGGPNDL